MPKKQTGRPKQGRKRINLCLHPDTIVKIDEQKDAQHKSRGRVVDSKFITPQSTESQN